MALRDELQAALQNVNVRAMLRAIRLGEGTTDADGYRRMFAGELFDSFADHPRKLITAKLGGKSIKSTAAGAYQFLSRTWDEAAAALQLPDFSPASQDLAAVFLIHRRGALDLVKEGRIPEAIARLNKEWASLPGSPYGQPVKTLAQVLGVYAQHGGRQAPGGAVAAAPAPVPAQVPAPAPARRTTPIPIDPINAPQGEPMSPFVLPAISALLEVVPKLGRIFSSGSEVAERNVRAAEIVVDVAKGAVGARNEQELIETVQNDPAAQQQVREAIDENWARIDEAAEKSIAAARQFVKEYTGERTVGVTGLTFVEILSLLLVVISSAGGMATLFFGTFSDEIRGAVVTLMLIGGWTGVKEFWFGSSRGSERKTEIMNSNGGAR